MERIVVYEGDTAEGLARDFCIKNNLSKEMEEKLRLLLDQQIAGVLPKINEDDENQNESEEDTPANQKKQPLKNQFSSPKA